MINGRARTHQSAADFLHAFSGKTVDYYMNRGNWGDALIYRGTLTALQKANVRHQFYTDAMYTSSIWKQALLNLQLAKRTKNAVALLEGGGNLIDLYTGYFHLLRKLPAHYDQVVLLPHTIAGNRQKQLLETLPGNVIIFCREARSYDFVQEHWPFAATNLYLSDDMAFSFDYLPYKKQGEGTLHAFRADRERTDIPLPPDNRDLSAMGRTLDPIDEFLTTIANAEQVRTNRLHVAIAAAMLDKETHLFPNSYRKNRAVYEQSMQQFPHVHWHEQ